VVVVGTDVHFSQGLSGQISLTENQCLELRVSSEVWHAKSDNLHQIHWFSGGGLWTRVDEKFKQNMVQSPDSVSVDEGSEDFFSLGNSSSPRQPRQTSARLNGGALCAAKEFPVEAPSFRSDLQSGTNLHAGMLVKQSPRAPPKALSARVVLHAGPIAVTMQSSASAMPNHKAAHEHAFPTHAVAKERLPLPGRTQTGPWATEILPSFYSSCRVRPHVSSERGAARNDVLAPVVVAPFAAQSGATFHAPTPFQFVFHASKPRNQRVY